MPKINVSSIGKQNDKIDINNSSKIPLKLTAKNIESTVKSGKRQNHVSVVKKESTSQSKNE